MSDTSTKQTTEDIEAAAKTLFEQPAHPDWKWESLNESTREFFRMHAGRLARLEGDAV